MLTSASLWEFPSTHTRSTPRALRTDALRRSDQPRGRRRSTSGGQRCVRFQPATNTQHACSSLHHTCPRGLARRATPASESTARATTGRSRCCARRHSHTSQAENVGWSLSLQEWPFGQDPRCPGCVSHCSPHYPAHAPRAHARAHTPGYSSWRRVSPCGPPPLSTVVGTSYQLHRK